MNDKNAQSAQSDLDLHCPKETLESCLASYGAKGQKKYPRSPSRFLINFKVNKIELYNAVCTYDMNTRAGKIEKRNSG